MRLIRGTTKYILPVSDVSFKRTLMGVFMLKFKTTAKIFESDQFELEYNNTKYTFNFASREGEEVTANHISYDLINYALLDKNFNTPPTYSENIDFAEVTLNELVSGFLSSIYTDAGYTLTNNVTTNGTVNKDISFAADNLLSALQKIAETYEVEFALKDDEVILCDTVGSITGIEIIAGVHTSKITKQLDTSNICSVVYPNGTSTNLPEKYYYSKLKPTRYAELTTDKTEDELFSMWNEDYPEWTGTKPQWKTAISEWDNTIATWKDHFQPEWTGNFTNLEQAIADWHEYLVLKEGKHYNILDTNEDGTPALSLKVEANVSELGTIERVVDFTDISVKSRRGTIAGVGRGIIEEKEFPYIYDASLSDLNADLAENYDKVGLMITDGSLHRAEDLRIAKFDSETNRLYYSEKLKKPEGETISFVPPVGSTYVLVGYITPVEVNAASQELYDKTLKYLEDNKEAIEKYKVSDMVLRGMDERLEVGDTVRLIDHNQDIDIGIRIESIEYNPTKDIYESVSFSTVLDKIPNDFLRDFLNTRNRLLQMKGSIDSFYAQLGDLAGALSDLNNEYLANLADNMQVLEDSLDGLNDVTLPGLQDDLDALESDLNTLNSVTLPELQSDIEANEAALSTLNTTTIPNLNLTISSNETAINILNNTTIPELESNITVNETAINTLNNTTIPGLNSAISSNETAINTLNNTTIPELESNIMANETSINTLNNTTIPGLNSAISANESAINTLNNTTIPSLEDDLSALNSELADINFTDLNGQISAEQITAATIFAQFVGVDKITANHITAGTITTDEIAADTITANNIDAGTITSQEIAAGTITALNIESGTITTNEIAADTITANNILAGTITTNEIAADTITANNIAAGTITTNEIAAGTITASNILAGTITTNEIAVGTITANNIAAGTITTNEIAADTITANNIATGTITTNEIAADTITANNIAAGTITTNEIAVGTITANNIAAGVITANEIATGTITTNEIATGTITASDIHSNTITTNEIAVGTITANNIAAGTITANEIETGTITTDQIAANTIMSNNIAAGQILASHIAVGGITDEWLADALETKIDNASTDATNALAELDDIAADSKLTPSEKLEVAREWGNIQEEYLKYLEQATSFEIGGTGSEFESYQAAYNALSSYITPLLSNMNVTTTVVRATFNSKFADYYENRGTFLNRLTNEVRAGSAVSIGVDSGGDGFVKVNEYIVDDTALERYWLFGKGGTSYNVKSSSDTLFSVNGGKIIGNSIVTFKAPDNPSVEETPNAGVNVYIAEKDGEKLGLDPNKVRCITTYAGITLLPNNDPVTTRTYSSPILSSGSLTGFRVYAVQSDSIEQFEFSHEEDNLSSSWTDYASVTSTTGSDAVYFYLILFSRKGLWIDISTSFEQTFIRTRDDPVIKKIVVQAKRHDGNQYDARVVFYDSSDAVIGTGTLLNNWVGHDNGHLKILTSAINDNYFISGGSYIDADINTTIIYS